MNDEQPVGRRRRSESGDRSSNRLRPQELQRRRLDAAVSEIGPIPAGAPPQYKDVRVLLALIRISNPSVSRTLAADLLEMLAEWQSDDLLCAADLVRRQTGGR